MSPASRASIWVVLVGALGLAGCVTVIVLLASTDGPQDLPPRPVPVITPVTSGTTAPEIVTLPAPEPVPAGPRRLPVGGQEGYTVVIEVDGSSYLEAPDGTKTQLATAGPALVEVVPTIASGPPPRRQLGQLVVCDVGVVDVPRGALIMYVGRDKVVVRGDDDQVTTYFTDGRVIRAERAKRTDTPRKF